MQGIVENNFQGVYIRPMSLPAYIEKHGIDYCARQWKVAPRTVRYWKDKTTRPTRKKVKRVMETSGLTIADIYG